MKLFFWTNSGNQVHGMPIRILQKEPSAFTTLGVLTLISFMGLLEHPNGPHGYQKRSRKRPKQLDLLRRGLESQILEKFVFFLGESQKNLASYLGGLFDERIISDNKQPVSTKLILQ